MRRRVLPLLAALTLVLTLAVASVALAHGGGEEAGTPWLNIALVGGGLVVFAGAAYFAITRRG